MASDQWTGNITASQLQAIYEKKSTVIFANTFISSIITISAVHSNRHERDSDQSQWNIVPFAKVKTTMLCLQIGRPKLSDNWSHQEQN
jgi:hypothetical protein